MKLIPAHVRELYAVRQFADRTGQQIQPTQLWRFFAGGVQRLQAEADTEEGNSAADGLEQWSTQIALIDGANECAEVADARQQIALRLARRSRPL